MNSPTEYRKPKMQHDEMREYGKKRAKHFNIGYITNQTLTDKVDAEAEWKSDFGVSDFRKTYYL